MSLNPSLLDILVCPVSKTTLVYDKKKQELISTSANLAFPVRDDIPVMLEDQARQITAEEAEHYRKLKA